MAQLPRGVGGIAVLGGAQELQRCSTDRRGQWAQCSRLGLDLMLSGYFLFQPSQCCENKLPCPHGMLHMFHSRIPTSCTSSQVNLS